MIEVYDKISEKKRKKKAEEERLAKELKEIRLQRQYLNASKAMVEEKAWKELEAGAERKVRNAQNQRLIDQCSTNEIKLKESMIKANNNKDIVKTKIETDKDYQAKLQTKMRENEVLHKGDLESKSIKHAAQKEFGDELKKKTIARNPYTQKINKQSIE